MKPNVVEHLVFEHKNWKYKAFLEILKKKRSRKKFYQDHVRGFYYDQVIKKSPLPKKSLDELVDFSQPLRLENFHSRNGNLSAYELMIIATVVAHRAPMRILEIGTFDGNTTLQMALNAPEEAVIHTIDLPENAPKTAQPVLDSDLQYIHDKKKLTRKFTSSSVAGKIIQHMGDSTNFDFSKFTEEGPLDLIFIDGGHSYDCVKSDTENALKILKSGGVIFWHDFTPIFDGVFRYLCELSKELTLVNIEGTHLVTYGL
ncbi:MAG: hypothetical protein KR126chlam1_00154 [Chlamydiae bacterium]|nr:hypothetical protein [Chlamydiota bacterium]